MNKTSAFSATAATFAAALLAMPLLAGSASASTTSKLMNCQFNSKQKVIDCCQRILKKYERPIWMINDNQSCSSAVKCVRGQTYARECYISIPQEIQNTRTPAGNNRNGGKI